MLHSLIQRATIWWRFKQLNRTFVPLLEKANAFNDREAVLKLEEQYWYQTACLLEEQREIRRGRSVRQYAPPPDEGLKTATPWNSSGLPHFGSERELVHGKPTVSWMVPLVILLGILAGLGGWWVATVGSHF